MDIDRKCAEALQRINAFIYKRSQDITHKLRLSCMFQILEITFRDRDHFYAVVNWCNRNVGKGKQFWTSRGRILRYIDPSKNAYNPPRITDIYIKVPGVDASVLLTF